MNEELNTSLDKAIEEIKNQPDGPFVQQLRRGANLWRGLERYYSDMKAYGLAVGCAEMAKLTETVLKPMREREIVEEIKRNLPALAEHFSVLIAKSE